LGRGGIGDTVGMAGHPVQKLTMEQYLELERAATEKHEYVDGEMVAMAGGSPRHALITANIGGALRQALRGKGCLTFSPDVRVCAFWDKLIAYPDVSIVCGPPAYADEKRDTLTNPTVLVEVLSPSTMNYDRGEKAARYRQMPSVKEFLIVEQEAVSVEHYRRLPDGSWQIVIQHNPDDVLRLESIQCELLLSEIYEGVDSL
jgi:Uma2 family endonuclease